MASVIKAGNATDGVQVTSDNTGILELKTGTGAGTTAMTVGTGQNVTFAQAANLPNTFGFKNRIINGGMVIDQRNAGASITQTASALYPVDRFYVFGSVTSKFTAQRNAGSVTPPAGYINYLGITSSSAYTVGASETYVIAQKIEGLNVADFGWGTANAVTVTLSFLVRSSLTGTFGGSITNSAGNRSYPFSYSISAANTWEQKSITIAGDTTGTWLTTNGSGVELYFSMGTGSTLSGTAGAWSGSALYSATGATSVVGTNGATFYITGVQLEKGSTATSFDYRPYGTELQLCQRYFFRYGSEASSSLNMVGGSPTASIASGTLSFPVTMRAAPTLSINGTAFTDGYYYDDNVSSLSSSFSNKNSSRVSFATSGVMTAGRYGYLICRGATSDNYIQGSAEL